MSKNLIKQIIANAGNMSFDDAWNEEKPPVEYILNISNGSIYSAPFIETFAELLIENVFEQLENKEHMIPTKIINEIKQKYGFEKLVKNYTT